MDDTADRPGPADPALRRSAALTAGLGVVAWVLTLVRPWGDTGVARDGTFSDARPVVHLVLLAVLTLGALVLAVRVPRGGTVRAARAAGALVVVVGAVALVSVFAVTTAQVFPRDGGWWAVVAAVAGTAAGALLLAAGVPVGPRRRPGWAVRAVATVVPLALVVVAGVVAPGWSGHVVDGRYPAVFQESPAPATITRIGWREDFGPDATSAVIGGRLIVVEDTHGGSDCRLTVRAVDVGTGADVWSSARTTRCNGPRVAAVDGNNTVLRITLRGPAHGDDALTGPATHLYVRTVDGRDVHPSRALDAVRFFTEGFGLVTAGDTVEGLDPATGVTVWSRALPRCDDGSAATLRVPEAPPAGQPSQIRTPYDSVAGAQGTVAATGVARDVVLALSCGTSPRMWLVDALGTRDDDRVVTLPVQATSAPGVAGGTRFLAGLETIVAAVPTEVDGERVEATTFVGVTLATGALAWVRPVGQVTAADVAPVDGSIRVTALTAGAVTTTTLAAADGKVMATTSPSAPAEAVVPLTAARVEISRQQGVEVVGDDGSVRTIALPGCTPSTLDAVPVALPGPGGIAVRCTTAYGTGGMVVGLVP